MVKEAARLRSGRNTSTISTGSGETDKKPGGGIPIGSLTLIEGHSDSGKSVVTQHLVNGSLMSGLNVVYYTAENTVRSLISQMGSLGMVVDDYFLMDKLRIFPFAISARDTNPEVTFYRLLQHITQLDTSFVTIVVDSITNLVSHSAGASLIDFFSSCKSECDKGRSIILTVHSYAFDEKMLIRVRSLCDAHLSLRIEEAGERLMKVLEVSKVRNAERSTGNIISFDVEPKLGMKIIPISKARA